MFHEITLGLAGISIQSMVNHPMSNMYGIQSTGGTGYLYLKNRIPNTTDATIFTQTAKTVALHDGMPQFELES